MHQDNKSNLLIPLFEIQGEAFQVTSPPFCNIHKFGWYLAAFKTGFMEAQVVQTDIIVFKFKTDAMCDFEEN